VHRLALYGAALAGAGAAGAAVTVGMVAAAGGLDHSTTTVREVVSVPSPEPTSKPDEPPTIHDIYVQAAPGVVQVAAPGRAVGSGFVIDKAGHVVTSLHVVQGARHARVSFSSHERLAARVVGSDRSTGLALLQVKARSRALTPLQLGSSATVRVGELVVAIGDPLGVNRSITSGIVSALDHRSFEAIQTDAVLDRGNSGGPLLDGDGRVIGVNSEMGLAVPIDTVKDVAAQLLATGTVTHPFVGIDARPITSDVATLFRLPVQQGLLVGRVCKSSGAARAGIRGATREVTLAGTTWPLGGDIIVKVDGVRVASLDNLHSIVAGKKPGDTVELELYRNTKTLDMKVKLGRQPHSPRC
jgi:S1-C subfamily serine protease